MGNRKSPRTVDENPELDSVKRHGALDLFTDEESQQPATFNERNMQMLIVLAEIGLSKSAIAALLHLADVDRDLIRFIEGPLVVHCTGWMADIPEWLPRQVVVERLRLILDEYVTGQPGPLVGPTEIMAVMFPRVMAAPLPMELSQIYLWASAHAIALHDGCTIAEIWDKLGTSVLDDDILNPSGLYHYDYKQITGEIRHKVIRAQTERARAEKRASRKNDTPADSTSDDLASVQLSFL